MNIKQVFEVEGKQRWNIPGENGQPATLGAKLFVTDGQLLNTTDKVGKFPTTFNVDYAIFDKVIQVPGKYELELSLKVGSKGQMAVSGVRYVGTETTAK